MFEDARNDAGLGNHSYHSRLTTTMRAVLQVNGEYALEPGHPAHRCNSNIGLAFVVRDDFDRDLGASDDICSLARVWREHPVVTNQMGFGSISRAYFISPRKLPKRSL